MPKVLIGSYPIRNQPGPFRDLLLAAGMTPVDPPVDGPMTEALYREYLPDVEAVLAGGEPLGGALIREARKLRVIARTGVGYDAVDLEAAAAQKIAVAITPGTNQGSVAEQTFALMLALSRNVVGNDQTIRGGGWDRSLVMPLRGLTLGLVGLGRIGRAVASRARAFDMRVIGCDPLPADPAEAALGVERVPFEDLIAQADIVSLHLPLVEATRNLINRDTLSLMKPGALLINTARGGLVAEADLAAALASGRLAGAGLDVLNHEPPEPGNPLIRLPNVVVSPHIGGIDKRGMEDMATMSAQCVVDLYQGRWPEPCIVNPEIRPGWTW